MASILLFSVALAMSGCTSGVPIAVTAIADPDADLHSIRSFDLAATSGNEPLIEKSLLRIARQELASRGYTHNTTDPDVLIAVLGDTEAQREFVPPSTTYTPIYEPGDTYTVTRKRTVNGTVVRSHSRVRTPGNWFYLPHTSPGYERTVFQKTLTIRILDATAAPNSEASFDAIPIWEARVTNTGPEPDLLKLAPLMIREALSEFPTPTGKPSRRTVPLNYG